LSETKTAPSARVAGTFVYTTRVRQKKALDFNTLKKASSDNQHNVKRITELRLSKTAAICLGLARMPTEPGAARLRCYGHAPTVKADGGRHGQLVVVWLNLNDARRPTDGCKNCSAEPITGVAQQVKNDA
jgi:hypothetical protein